MKKSWLVSILAALFVIGAGTAIASVPSGSGTSFNVGDPAVTVIASGQTAEIGGAAEKCEFAVSTTTYCKGEPATNVTPNVNGICDVTTYDEIYGFKFGTLSINAGSGYLEEVVVGLDVWDEGSSAKADDSTLTVTPTALSSATITDTHLVPVEAGKTYSFGPYVWSYGSKDEGSVYWTVSFVCYGA